MPRFRRIRPPDPEVILVCGGRKYWDRWAIYSVLDKLRLDRRIGLVVTGDAPGADFLASLWAKDRRIRYRRYLADWDKHGPAAGPIRNKEMLDESKPALVVAFPGGKGTENMKQLARDAGVPVMEIEPRVPRRQRRKEGPNGSTPPDQG